MTTKEIYSPEKANKGNAKEYDRLCVLYDSGDSSVLPKMAECIINATELRDIMEAINFDPEG